MLTIGYGDFYPQDNSAKPVFVLWSLIALPTLTVLIGSVGGIINEGVNTLTLWIGENLPEKSRALSDMKGEAAKAKGSAFQSAKPPGFMEEGKAADAVTGDQAHAEAVTGTIQSMQENNGSNAGHDAAGKQYRLYLLMKEMKNVVQHLNATPPRKYSYAEWTWFLKLLGEDESDLSRHKNPQSIHGAEVAADAARRQEPAAEAHDEDDQIQPWSWLGRRSPLMTSTDEPQWVLERLMDVLERELKEQGGDTLAEAEKTDGT